MARTVRQQDAQVRLAIRTDYDANPNQTYKGLQDKFGVNYSSVILAMRRTADEWRALLDGLAAKPAKPRPVPTEISARRGRGRPPVAKPSVISDVQEPALPVLDAGQSPVAFQAPSHAITWDYKAIVVRRKGDSDATTFEFQDSGSVTWQSVAAKGFDGILAMFGKEGWELIHITVLNHGNKAFTGLFEIVFKRSKID
jgi:hypothetical protein